MAFSRLLTINYQLLICYFFFTGSCLLCRPADAPPPHLNPALLNKLAAINSRSNSNNTSPLPALQPPPSQQQHPLESKISAGMKSPGANTTNGPAVPAASIVSSSLQELQVGQQQQQQLHKSKAQFLVDGVCLSEGGMNHLRSMQLDQPRRRVRGKGKNPLGADSLAGQFVSLFQSNSEGFSLQHPEGFQDPLEGISFPPPTEDRSEIRSRIDQSLF